MTAQITAPETAGSSSAPVALVTGGSRGIGRAICIELAGHGYAIDINYATNEAAAQETQVVLGATADSMLCRADVGNRAERERLVDDVLARWNRIDVLINNAAISSLGRRDLLEASEESWDRVLAVNLKAPYFLCQRVGREMLVRLPQLVHPALINIGSLSAYTASTNRGDYCVAKAGLTMVTQLFAARLAESGIAVYEVQPGVIETDLTAGNRQLYTDLIQGGLTPIRRWGQPQDVARAVAALVTGQFPFSTGNVVEIDGGFHIRRL